METIEALCRVHTDGGGGFLLLLLCDDLRIPARGVAAAQLTIIPSGEPDICYITLSAEALSLVL